MNDSSVCNETDNTTSDQATHHPQINKVPVVGCVGSNCESTSDDESYENLLKTKRRKRGSDSISKSDTRQTRRKPSIK